MQHNARTLIVDASKRTRHILRTGLETKGYHIHEASTGQMALLRAAQLLPHLIVLDLALTDLDGLEVLGCLREWATMPIIALTKEYSSQEKTAALDAGADSYIVKSTTLKNLPDSVHQAYQRERQLDTNPVFTCGNFQIDLVQRIVTVRGQEVSLTPTEYALLHLMVKNAGKVLTHQQILRTIWGPEYSKNKHYLRVYFGHLRNKLEVDPTSPRILLTEPGVGYRFETEAWQPDPLN